MNKLNNKIKENFTMIPNDIIRNKALSDRARILFCYMASMPDDWKFYQAAMAKELGYAKDTLRKYLDELINTGYLEREQRREKGKFDSYDYTINFQPQPKKADTVKSRSGENPTRKKSSLTNKDFEQRNNNTNKDFDKGCEKEFSPLEEPKIKNSFTRQSIASDLNTSSSDSVLSSGDAPNSTYAAFSAFCSTYERLAGVTYPTNENGNYIMAAKDGANTKRLVTWLRKVSKSEGSDEDLMTQFITAAWQIADKWMKANFTISVIFGQCNNIYTKYMYNNPIAAAKRRQEEIDRLVNEFEG